jgi:hypothetical protein
MKAVRITVASAAMFLLGASPVFADSHEEESDGGFIPIEIFACNFEDGKGPDDLNTVTAKWNEWMDEEGAGDYFAAHMYPNYSTELGFDVGWIGGWRDGNAMGAGTDMWLGSGGEVGAEFDEVLDCPSHTLFASAQMKDPGDSGEDDNNFVLSFSNCSMQEGKTFEEVEAAQKAWNAHADEHGFVGGAWYFWPVWGESGDADYDFKAVGSASSYTALGANFQLMADGHWRNSQEIWEGLLDCDSARIYTTVMVREMADDED